MKKVGLIYSMETEKTSQIAKKIAKEFAEGELDEVNLVEAWGDDFRRYDNLILGTSTWFDGELPDHWSEIIPKVKTIDFKGKKVAIYGLGDQKHYPDPGYTWRCARARRSAPPEPSSHRFHRPAENR